MKEILPENLKILAQTCPAPLYVVGGSVRDRLAGYQGKHADWDICAPIPAERFSQIAAQAGFKIHSVYAHTGTVKLSDPTGTEYEFASFRSDRYVRGEHTPSETFFTTDILLDAKRRDFTANAVYYDVAAETFVDPLQGIPAIVQKRLTTVDRAEKVFGEDGLRLMRLARQAAQLGFTPDEECLKGATKHAALIQDVSPERIYTELTAILTADKRYGNATGHYDGLCLLEQTGVLSYILPELTAGKGMLQRADFHKYDILQHSLRAVLYADEEVRLAALLHDVGKPYCQLRDGNVFAHPVEGATIAENILTRLKAPKKTKQLVKDLVQWHMYDFDCRAKPNKLRRFFVQNSTLLAPLMKLKQADFSGCMDDPSPAPTNQKWQALYTQMQQEGVAFSLKELPINGNDVLSAGIPPQCISEVLNAALLHVAVQPQDNKRERLLPLLSGLYNTVRAKKRAGQV